MQRITIKELLIKKSIGLNTCVKGWVRTKRNSKQVIFIMVNDGSTIHSLQVVIDASQLVEDILANITPGASLSIEGTVIASPGGEQAVELHAEKIEVLGTAPNYPLQPKRHSLEFLREIAHLRFRTNTFGAVFRIRHAVSYAIHQFFHTAGFTYLHTPIITAIDAEGAGNMFGVSTLDLTQVPKKADGGIDFKTDFFGQKTSLTVSGQLEAEAAALGLGAVYTFGPTFRAENSNTARHLAEFWMVEPEVAFNDLYDNITLAESFLKYIIRFVLENCQDDLAFLHKRAAEAQAKKTDGLYAIPLLDKLHNVISDSFTCITYTEAIDILKSSKPNQKKNFSYAIDAWGCDLQSEHERYLVEEHFKKPVVITHYPSAIKAFYMRQEENNTVAAMDVLFPGIGEIIGGSQREERLDKLTAAMHQKEMNTDVLKWYLETRLFGTIQHSGFGLGLERLVLFITGMDNIRDVIAFPRTPGHADF